MTRISRIALIGAATLRVRLGQWQEVTGAGPVSPRPCIPSGPRLQQATGVKVNYQPSAPGGHQADRRQDRGLRASDMPQKGTETWRKRRDAIPDCDRRRGFPSSTSRNRSRTDAVNGPGAGDIYLGKITKWNDPAIKALNPSGICRCAIARYRRPMVGARRSFFTNYLSKGEPGLEGESRRGHGPSTGRRARRQGQRRRGRVSSAGCRIRSVRGIRIREAEQDDLPAHAECRGNFVQPKTRPSAAAPCRMVEELLPDPHEPAGRGFVAITGATFI